MTNQKLKELEERVNANKQEDHSYYICIGRYTGGDFLSYYFSIPEDELYMLDGGDMKNNNIGNSSCNLYFITPSYWEKISQTLDERIKELEKDIKTKSSAHTELYAEISSMREELAELLTQKKQEDEQKILTNLKVGQKFEHHTGDIYVLAAIPNEFVLISTINYRPYSCPKKTMQESFCGMCANFKLVSE